MKKTLFALLCAFFILLPFPVVALRALVLTPPQYDETFLGELSEKHARLKSDELSSSKVVLVGGSSLAFGLDSALLEKYLKMPVVNYGLYAAIGTKAMLDLSENYLNKGDIVVLCPEIEQQTYSLYFNGESMLQAADGNLSLLADAARKNFGKLLAALPRFAADKISFYRSGTKPGASGIYSKDSFNKYGDIAVERRYNEMRRNYDSTMPVRLSTEIIGEGFLDYLNDYAAKASRRGASVYFSFSPVNESAVVTDEAEKEAFYRCLGENLDFPIISSLDDYILNAAYFYDTNFHLNTRGAKLRTALLADDILRETGKTAYVETVKYTAPKRPDDYFDSDDSGDESGDEDAEAYFVYEKIEGGLVITGLTEEGLLAERLTIPRFSDGNAVIEIGAEAFSESHVLKTVVIPADTNLAAIGSRAFAGCSALERIENYALPSSLSPASDAFDGMRSGCAVYVPAENYTAFAGDYFWGGRMRYVKSMEDDA